MRNKVLIITYYWPPAAGPGVQRWLKFSKYLPEFDWQPYIATTENGSYPAIDESLLEEVSEDIEVERIKTLEPHQWYNLIRGKSSKTVEEGMSTIKDSQNPIEMIANRIRSLFFVPDARMGWNLRALPKIRKIIRDEKIDTIITTGPPHSTHLMGYRLKKKFALKWIADLRDPWTTMYYNAYLKMPEYSKRKDRRLENKVIRFADAITVVGPGMKEEFIDRNSNVFVIYNGYDDADVEFLNTESDQLAKKDSEYFRLSYVGNFKIGQDHDALWQAISELVSADEEFGQYFRLEFTGNVNQYTRENLIKHNLEHNVVFHGYLPHRMAMRKMRQAQMVLFITSNTKGNQKLVTGKIFEYLASATPIFAIGHPSGDAAEILQECQRESIMDFNQKTTYKKRLSSLFSDWFNNRNLPEKVYDNTHQRYSRRNQTAEIASILNNLSSN